MTANSKKRNFSLVAYADEAYEIIREMINNEARALKHKLLEKFDQTFLFIEIENICAMWNSHLSVHCPLSTVHFFNRSANNSFTYI